MPVCNASDRAYTHPKGGRLPTGAKSQDHLPRDANKGKLEMPNGTVPLTNSGASNTDSYCEIPETGKFNSHLYCFKV